MINAGIANNDFILQLIKIKKQLNLISDNQVNYLKSYITNDNFFALNIFHKRKIYKTEEKAFKFAQLSLCFALMSLLKSKFAINKIERQLKSSGLFQEFIDKLLDERYNSWWLYEIDDESNNYSFNNFVIPFILLFLKSVKDEKVIRKSSFDNQFIKKVVRLIVKNLQKYDYYFLHQGKKNPSPFITYYSIETLYKWYDEIENFINGDDYELKKIENKKLLADMKTIFEDVFLWARDILFQQIAYYSANDSDRKDPYLALYCILIYKRYNSTYKNKLYFLNSDYNKYVVKKLIEYLLKDENSIESIWEKKDLITSIDYVSIYTFGLSTLTEFFSVMDPDEYDSYFINSVNKMLQWIFNNEKKGDSIKVTFYNNDKAW